MNGMWREKPPKYHPKKENLIFFAWKGQKWGKIDFVKSTVFAKVKKKTETP